MMKQDSGEFFHFTEKKLRSQRSSDFLKVTSEDVQIQGLFSGKADTRASLLPSCCNDVCYLPEV